MKNILRLSRPLHLLLSALTYLLGVSIADYLGKTFRDESFWLGLVIVLLAQAGMSLLAEVFRPHNEPLVENESPLQKETLRNNMLYTSVTFLTAGGVMAFLLFTNHRLSFTSFVFLLLSLGFLLAYSLPPFRLIDRGFGEFLLAAQIAYVYPSLGFLLQADDYQSIVMNIALPLTALALAYFLVLNFPSFQDDQKYQRMSLLRRLTWEHAVPLHHSLLTAAYILFLAASIFVLSPGLLWPAFLTLPFAIIQIILVRHIALGGTPNWTLLTATALSVFGLTAYFLTLTFWLR